MRSWAALPDAPLARGGGIAAEFRRLGCATYRDAARHLRALPYGRNADRADPALVLREGRGTCSTKHALLAQLARELGLAVQLSVGIYDLSEADTPGVGAVLARHGLASLPEAHCYLVHEGERIDVTRSGVAPAAPIERFHEEWPIEPHEIGARKPELHRRYLARCLADRPELGLALDALWKIREACIAALGEG